MQRQLIALFRNGSLQPSSELVDLKHIGPYLYARLKREFAPTSQRLTIRMFSNRIKNLSIEALKKKLQKSLQNRRNNQCVASNNTAFYHVADFNEKGYEILISLIKVLDKNGDGYNMGNGFRFNANELKKPTKRSDDTKYMSCLSRVQCRRNGGNWSQGVCIPSNDRTGFPGVSPHSGQKTRSRIQSHRLGSFNNSIRRGQYVRSGRYLWRRPGSMQHV